MKDPIDILMVEDTPAFVAKISRALRRAGLSFHLRRIKTKESFLHELERHRPDVILSGHVPPSFHRFTALAIARETRPDVPFVFVTDSNDARHAAETLDIDAPEGVLQSSLPTLARTLRGALREARQRNRLRDMELAVLTSRWSD